MSRKKVNGFCHICGTEGPLSFEHIPPEAAFNDLRSKAYTFGQLFLDEPGYKTFQHGFGEYSLCEKCNNDTGAWYGSSYLDFIYQVIYLNNQARIGNIDLSNGTYDIYPLRVLKQIITIFFTVNYKEFRSIYPSLTDFVLNKENAIFDERLHVYAYMIEDMVSTRITPGVVGMIDISTGQTNLFSEFAYPPVGYILAFDENPFDARLVEITQFKNYSYYDKAVVKLPFIPLPIANTGFGEFRTVEEITFHNSKIKEEKAKC